LENGDMADGSRPVQADDHLEGELIDALGGGIRDAVLRELSPEPTADQVGASGNWSY
jgi:hypothetical protein